MPPIAVPGMTDAAKTAALVVAAVLAASLAGNSAAAGGHSHGHSSGGYSHNGGYNYHHGNGARFAFFAGAVFPAWYYYPYNFPPAYFSQAPLPLYYVEQSDPEPKYYWFFCQAIGTYYPYVDSCATGWQPVLPHSDAK